MPFTEEDKIIIKYYRSGKGYGRTKLLKEFIIIILLLIIKRTEVGH